MADISSMSTSDLISSLGSGSAPVNNPDTFSASYGPAAVAAGKALGVDPHLLLGQWGLETGWGKSVIPGTNNLGNIKDTSGNGPKATDNVTGSTDSYRSFSSPMQFAQGYVNLIKNKYPQAVGTGSNAQAFFSGLKAGGYAEDPKYVSKGVNAANTVAKSPSFLQTVGNAAASLISGTANAAEAPQNPLAGTSTADLISAINGSNDNAVQGNSLQGMSTADLISSLGNGQPAPQAPGHVTTTTNPVMMGARDAIYSKLEPAMQWLSKGANWIAPNSQFAKDVGQGIQDLHATNAVQQQAYDNAPHSFGSGLARGATSLAGQIATSPMTGGGIGTMAIQGAAQGALDNPDNPLAGAGYGAAGAAVGDLVGKGVGKVVGAAAKPVLAALDKTKAGLQAADAKAAALGQATGEDFSPAELSMASKIANSINSNADATGQSALGVAGQLHGNADSAVPGYLRTAAEATDNPTIQALQQGLDKSDNNSGLAARANTNADANTAFLRQGATSDADLTAQREAFEQQQAALEQRGNAEMPAVTQAQDQTLFNTPAMQRTLGRANVLAQNDGNDVIQQAFRAPNDDMVNAWNGVAGSPQKTANLELQRQIKTSPMYEDVLNASGPIGIDPQMAGLMNTPAMQRALRAVETFKLNARDDTPVLQDVAGRGADGGMYAQSISPQDLNLAKMHLDDYMQRMGNPTDIASADKFELSNYARIRSQINNMLEQQVPGFAKVNQEYAKLSDQMAESKFLTNQNMVDAFGNLNVRQLDAMVKAIQAGKANNNEFDPAKAVSNAKLAQLMQMRDDAVAMLGHNNATGLRGDAYSYMRQAAERDPAAAQAMQQHLEANSPAYRQFYGDQQAGTSALNQQENYNNLVKKFDTRTDGNVTWQDTKNLGDNYADFSPENVARLNAVRENQQRFVNRTEKVAGSDTASNFAKREGFDNLVAAERGNGVGNWLMGESGQRAVRAGIGPLASVLGFSHGGPVGAVASDWMVDKAGTKLANAAGKFLGGESEEALASKTAANRNAVEHLLLNPKRLADALNATGLAKAEKDAITNSLISKVKGVQQATGLLGAIAGGQIGSNTSKK